MGRETAREENREEKGWKKEGEKRSGEGRDSVGISDRRVEMQERKEEGDA